MEPESQFIKNNTKLIKKFRTTPEKNEILEISMELLLSSNGSFRVNLSEYWRFFNPEAGEPQESESFIDSKIMCEGKYKITENGSKTKIALNFNREEAHLKHVSNGTIHPKKFNKKALKLSVQMNVDWESGVFEFDDESWIGSKVDHKFKGEKEWKYEKPIIMQE